MAWRDFTGTQFVMGQKGGEHQVQLEGSSSRASGSVETGWSSVFCE